MANDPAFLFYPGDYLRDTQCLSEPVQVAYDRIMCEHMRNICISYEQHNFFTKRLTDEQKKELMMVLTEVPGGYQITWVADSIEKRRNYSESRRNNRKGKEKHMSNISSSYVSHMENENVIENEIKNTNTIEEGDWQSWGAQIVRGEDQYWEQMHGRKVTQKEMDAFLSVATRKKWEMNSQQEFRVSLKGFEPLNQNGKHQLTQEQIKKIIDEA